MSELQKISVELENGAFEHLWATPLGGRLFRVENSPFAAYGLSHKDEVEVELREGLLAVLRIVRRGGHSTYRVRLADEASLAKFMALWPRLEALGCTYEGAFSRAFSIDVPPTADLEAVYAMLEEAELAGFLEFEEAHYCDPDEAL